MSDHKKPTLSLVPSVDVPDEEITLDLLIELGIAEELTEEEAADATNKYQLMMAGKLAYINPHE